MKATPAKKRSAARAGDSALKTRLRCAERRLRELEQLHDAVMSGINEGVYDWNVARDTIEYSDRVQRAVGLPADLMHTTADWVNRIHPDDLPRYRAGLIEHFKGGTARYECDYRYRALDGSWRWARQHGVALRDEQGRAYRMIGSTGDITELKQAEDRLRKSEERYALATSAAVEGIYEWDVATGALFLTDRAKALFSFPADQLTPADWKSRVHGEDYPGYRQAIVDHFKQLTAYLEHEYRIADARGGYKWILDCGRGVRDTQGRVVRIVGALSDITQRKLAELELRRARDEAEKALAEQTATAEILRVISGSPTDVQPVFDAIVTSGLKLFAGAAIAVVLPDGDQVRGAAIAESDSQQAIAWKGRFPFPLSREYMHGASILDHRLIDIPDAQQAGPEFARGIRNFLASGYRAITIMPMMRGDTAIGAISVVRLKPGALSDKQVALLRTFADQAVIAIEHVRLFNEIRESLEQQKAAGEVLRVISSSIADTAPVFDKILESCQRLFAGRIVGLNLMGEDGMLHMGAYHGAHHEEFERTFPYPATAESGSGLSIVEQRVVHFPDAEHGDGVPAKTRHGCRTLGIKSVIFAPILWEGRGVGAMFVGRDHVSSFSDKEIALLQTFAGQAAIAIENVRLFNEIQQKSRQLEVASRHKSEFLAHMSHELRTPLNAIIGFTRIVMRRSQPSLEPRQYENLEKILASGEHLLALINAILDLSKVEAGRVEVHLGEVALAPVLEHCVRTVEPLVKAGAVSLVKEFDGGLPEMYVDEEKLRRIVINLLSNAAKFTSRGSIRVRARAADGAVAIAVADTGIGIAPDKLGLIFEEFEQADASSTRVYGGTGLGLTIARRLARLMGGDIEAQSAPGSGSTFTLKLPLRYCQPAA